MLSIVVGALNPWEHPADLNRKRTLEIDSAPIGSHTSSRGRERRRSVSYSWRIIGALLGFTTLATSFLTQLGAPSAGAAIRAPQAAWSHYVRTTNPRTLSRLGCQQGMRMRRYPSLQSTITVLDFGRPVHLRKHRRGRAFGPSFYGVSLFRKRGFATVGDVRDASEAYAQGVLNCTKARWDIHLRIAIGTSNWGTGVTRGHGRAWARMVNQANVWIQAKGFSRKIDFAGANDIELSWNSPRRTRNWVDGYESAAMYPYYNYGAADACPPRGDCAGAWTLEDVWYVSWGALHAWPLPEIYTPNSSQALQWYNLALYSYRRHGSQMSIAGVMSQRGACIAARDPCRGMNNSPHRAWHQLFNLLNRDPRTRQQLQWVTDIR